MGSAFFVSCLGLRRLLGDNLAVHVKMVSGSLDFRQWLQDHPEFLKLVPA